MADLVITVDYDKETPAMDAVKVLKFAKDNLALLRELDKELNKVRRPKVKWSVNIYSLSDRAVIEFTAIRGNLQHREIGAIAAAIEKAKP